MYNTITLLLHMYIYIYTQLCSSLPLAAAARGARPPSDRFPDDDKTDIVFIYMYIYIYIYIIAIVI